jgi:hypothetical protein
MAPLVLPIRPRRAWRQAFWLVLSSLVVVTGLLLGTLVSVGFFGVSVAGLAGAAIGMAWPRAIDATYRVWNRGAAAYAQAARVALKAMAYFVVVTVVGSAGHSVVLQGRGGYRSLWETRDASTPRSYAQQYLSAGSAAAPRGWVRTYLAWALRSGHLWSVVLLPIIGLLSFLEPREIDEHVTPGIYTLF